MSKRILITGASGFIGANLARRVLRDGHEIHLLLRRGFQTWRLKEILGDVCVHEGELHDRKIVRAAQPDWVFHLAAYGAYPRQNDIHRMVETNLMGCVSLADACADLGVQAFVNAGSSSEYGLKDHPADEEEAIEPNSGYAITKAAATQYCRFAARERGLNAVTARLYSIYGPYEDPARLIPALIAHGLRGELPPLVSPATARDFVYVEDAVDAMLKLASASPQRGSVYNVCSGHQMNLKEVVTTARAVMNIHAEPVWSTMPARSWDTDVWVGSGAKLERDLGWRATTDFRTGLKQTVDWYSGRI
ncbi:MAG TPA: NAD-dependent epimerase/dehydratase family protein [Bryobacteraceae bacterium]|nr:NAD-dependent epimerase/dehydratase family protein [Bryobacteraceae bacterium]